MAPGSQEPAKYPSPSRSVRLCPRPQPRQRGRYLDHQPRPSGHLRQEVPPHQRSPKRSAQARSAAVGAMALVELDDDLVKELTRLLNHSNKQAVEMGFRPWTLSEMIRDMIW